MPKNTFDILRSLIEEVSCKPGWVFQLIDSDDEGFRLCITDMKCIDAYNPGKPFPLSHFFPVPTATYNEASWRRWIYECCRGVENHELGEWLRWGEERPFVPMHGPGENPYYVREVRSELDARTTQNGTLR